MAGEDLLRHEWIPADDSRDHDLNEEQVGENVRNHNSAALDRPHPAFASTDREGNVRQLAELLANDYPQLRKYMGDTKFTALARAYIAQHPSGTLNARWYSRHLRAVLRNAYFFERSPELAEMAELERALNDAFNATEAPIVTLADLAGFDSTDFGTLSIAASPSLRRFKVRSNVTSLWASLQCDELPPLPIALDADQELLVWRQGSAARFRMLGNEEAIALDAAIQGIFFSAICEMIAAVDDYDTAEARAAAFLRGWIEAEIISELRSAVFPGENSPGQPV